MKIAVYSGSFNPLHIGHRAIIAYLTEKMDFSTVYLIVSPKNPLKDMIKQKYAFGYQMSVKAASVIEEVLHKKISEDELAYLALIFSLSLEKEKRYESNYKKKNIN